MTSPKIQLITRFTPKVNEETLLRPVSSLTAVLNSSRPKLHLPQGGRLLSDFAQELGAIVRGKNIYQRGGLPFTVNGTALELMTPETLRSWVEQHVVCFTERPGGKDKVFSIHQTMTTETARGVLASPQFIKQLPAIEKLNPVRLPVMRGNGTIELLPEGHDAEAQTYTHPSNIFYDEDMTPQDGKNAIDDLLSEFCFASDGGRSKAVAISAMLTLFARGLLPDNSLVPCFLNLANSEGAGKTLLASCGIVAIYGARRTEPFPRDESEMSKILLSKVMEGASSILFDNVKGHINSPSLEGFLTATRWSGRVLGQSKTFDGQNSTTVFITGNGITISPDLRRRTLHVDLFMEQERAEDRNFKRTLDDSTLINRRAEILSALWAIVRGWDEAGRPKASRAHSSFPAWAECIGGIVECAGWASPLAVAPNEASADTDGADMRKLVCAMRQGVKTRFTGIVDLCRATGLFERMIPEDGELDAKTKSLLGKLLARYSGKLFMGHTRFLVEGAGHGRYYIATHAGISEETLLD